MVQQTITTVRLGSGKPKTEAAYEDVRAALSRWRLWTALGWLDVKQRYRRAVIGPFWITISMTVLVGSLGVLYAGIFRQEISIFLPYIAAGFIVWFYFSSIVQESTGAFMSSEGLIKYGGLPLFLHLLRLIFRNIIIAGHNLIVMALIYVWQPHLLTWNLLLFIPGLLLVIANLIWIATVVGILCTRFRDLPPIVGNLLQIMIFISPIMYQRTALPPDLAFIVYLNPVYYVIEVMRAPMLGEAPPMIAYLILAIFAVLGWFAAFRFFARTRGRLAYWL
jgi:ABC-type polysaccharide/polyol phosphate export permease